MKTLEGSNRGKLFKQPATSSSVSDETIAKAIRNIRVQLPTYHRCFYSLCSTPSEKSVYKHCGRCKIARYCSVDCQKADWGQVHRHTCNKPESITVGNSIAIRPVDSYLSLLPPTLYPSASCLPPSNELHGIVTAVHTSSPPTVEVEIFDCNVIPSETKISVAVADAVASGWDLDGERDMAGEKQRLMEEAVKRKAEREVMLAEEEKVYQAKRRAKAERVQALVQKKKQEALESESGNVGVDWTLFESELMENLDDEDIEDEADE